MKSAHRKIENLIKTMYVESIYLHFLPSHSEKVFDPFIEIYLLNFWFICSGYCCCFRLGTGSSLTQKKVKFLLTKRVY